MEGYSSAVFSNTFENKFSEYTVEGFQTFGTEAEQYNILNDLVGKYQSISGDLVDYNELKDELITGIKNPDGSKDDRLNEYNDYDGTKLDIEKIPTVKDAAKEDIDTMIVQQNNTYILGMVTVTTLLITSFLFIRG
jgi:hypothetical protein